MKKLLLTLLLVCPVAVLAQTQQDYEHMMALFKEYYNQGDTNKICQMFRPAYRYNCSAWKTRNLKEYGKMLSQKFVGIDSMFKSDYAVRVFKIGYSLAGVQAMSFSLRENPAAATNPAELPFLFGTFSFNDMTPRIEQMVKQVR